MIYDLFQQAKQYLLNNMRYGENGKESRRPHGMLVPLIMPDMSRVWGIDISHWNIPPVDLLGMKEKFGLKFVIIKGCDGSIRARYVLDHVATAKAAGLPFGLYNWLYPGNKVSLDTQTNAWVKLAKEVLPPMGIVIDAEWTTFAGTAANPNSGDLRGSHDRIKSKWGKSAITYTAKGYSDTYLKDFDYSREPLWVASYGGTSPLIPKGATRWDIWQFTSTLDGKQLDEIGNHELDGNYFNGDESSFKLFFNLTDEPLPPVQTKRFSLTIDGIGTTTGEIENV